MNTARTLKIWNKGAEYCRTGAVSVELDEQYRSLRILKGKVNCNFGYVHKPLVAVSEEDGLVAAAECDCYEMSELQPFCSHCAAVVRSLYQDRIRRVEIDPSIDLKRITNTKSQNSDPVELVQITRDGFSVKAEGIARCNFGYVHRPKVTVEDGRVVEYYCDCYLAVDSDKMCPHCRSLYALMSAEDGASENAEETEESAPELPEEISEEPEEQPEEEVTGEESVEEPAEEPSDEEITGEKFEEEPVEESFDEEPEEQAETEEAAEETEEQPEAEEIPEEPEIILHEPETMEILFGTAAESGAPVCWYPNDTNRLFHTNTGIIGTMGTGKTQFTKAMIAQLYWEQAHNYTGTPLGILIFDYKGDYNETKPEFVDAVSAKVIKPHLMPFNPFALSGMKAKPQLPLQVANTFATIIEKIYHLGPKQTTMLRHCVIEAYENCGIKAAEPSTWSNTPPTFKDVFDIYDRNEEIKKNDSLYSAMDILNAYEIFESDSTKTKSLYEMLRGVVTVDLSGYDSEIQHLVVAIMLELFYSQMQNSGSSQMSGSYRQLTKFLLVDEADNFMSQGFNVLKKIMKEGREFGVGTILSTQSLEHFSSADENYASMILTWVVHQVPDLERPDLEFLFNIERRGEATERLLQQIRSLEKHQSVVKIGTKEPVYIQDKPFWKLLEEKNG